MLISYSVPDIEIRRSKSPIALAISAGYIKPHTITARGNYFVINDKKVRGIYAITNKYKYTWSNTPCYWYCIQESNPIDPVMVDNINKFMEANSLITLQLGDIKHGVRLRQLSLQHDRLSALQQLQSEEKVIEEKLEEGLKVGEENIEKAVADLQEQYDKNANMDSKRKSSILLDSLLEKGNIDQREFAVYQQSIDKDELMFDTLIVALRESHTVRIIEPLDEVTERFIYDLSKQNADEWAGHTQDLRNTKRGLGEMVSRQTKPMLSYYAAIPPVPMLLGMFVPEIELHYLAKPVAVILYKNRIILKRIYSDWNYFVISGKNIGGVYSIDHTCQYMWGKTRCYVYNVVDGEKPDHKLLKEFKKYVKRKVLYGTVKIKGQRTAKPNSIVDHLVSNNLIDSVGYAEFSEKINNSKIDFDDLVETMNDKGLITVRKPLNLDVEGFISVVGAQNAQEWAGLTQDLRNDKKGLADMTKTQAKSFLSAGIVLAIGISITIAAVVIPSNWEQISAGFAGGNGTGFTLNPLDMFKPKPAGFLDILSIKTPTLFGWMLDHIPWLMSWLA